MGNGRWDAAAFANFTRAHTAGRARAEVFGSSHLLDEFNPAQFMMRESRDSALNPLSTPIMLFSDVTGSMGMTAEYMIRTGLDVVMREIYQRKPVTDPHILVGAIGDATCDRAPVQMTQFEGDVVLADQMRRIWIEGGGGGNAGESYLAAHYAAGMKTSTDAFEKRGKKGFLFTVGDEPNLGVLTRREIKSVFGIDSERDLGADECLAIAERTYEVFHIVLTNVGYARANLARVLGTWQPLLGQRVLKVSDHAKVGEVIVATLQVLAGESAATVASSWSGSTAIVVGEAIKDIARTATKSAVHRFI